MDKHSVFSKTGKGLLEIKNKSNRLPKEQFRILNLVDGKTVFADLAAQSRIPEIELRKVVTALEDGGYIKELISQTDENDPGSGVSVSILVKSRSSSAEASNRSPASPAGETSSLM